MEKYIFSLTVVLLFSLGAVAESQTRISVECKLIEYIEEYWYSIPVDMDGVPDHVDTVCPLAVFQITKPKEYKGEKLKIAFCFGIKGQESSLEIVKNPDNLGKIFEINIPSPEVDMKYFIVLEAWTKGIKLIPQQAAGGDGTR